MGEGQYSIVVTEPDADVSLVTAAFLRALGHRVRELPAWNDVIEYLKKKNEVDIIVTNFHRPGDVRSGYEFLREVWTLPLAVKPKAIILTSFNPTRRNQPQAEDYYELHETGIPVIQKPELTRVNLERAIERLFPSSPSLVPST